ncbi:hypothetical protein BOX15_Mlig014984g3, partial [Macrostomum lignano]
WPRMADISDSDEDDDSFADAAAAAAAAATARAPPPSLYSLCFAELADQARDHRGAASAPGLHNEDWRLAGQLLAHLSAAQPRAVRGRHLRDLAAGPGLTELDLTACCLLAPADLRAALPACPGLRRLRLAQCSQLVLDKRLLTDLPRLAPRLRCLELDQCDSLTGAALRCVLLSGRRRLRRLSAAACPLVCDSAFASLPAGGGRLRRVNLSGTRVTAAGLRDLCRFAGRHLRSLTATHLAELRPLFDCLAEISEATSVGEDERATEPIAMDRQADSAQPKPQSGGSSYHSCASESASSLADSDVADDSEADNFCCKPQYCQVAFRRSATMTSCPLPPQFPNSHLNIPPFLRSHHPYTKWMINMIRGRSHHRLTTMVRRGPSCSSRSSRSPTSQTSSGTTRATLSPCFTATPCCTSTR